MNELLWRGRFPGLLRAALAFRLALLRRPEPASLLLELVRRFLPPGSGHPPYLAGRLLDDLLEQGMVAAEADLFALVRSDVAAERWEALPRCLPPPVELHLGAPVVQAAPEPPPRADEQLGLFGKP